MKIYDNKSLCNNKHCRHGMVIWTKWAIVFFLVENDIHCIYMQFNLIFTWLLYTNVRETRRDNQIKNGQSRNTGNCQHWHKTKTNKNKKQQHAKLKIWATRTQHLKNRRWTQVLTKGKQFLLRIRHPPCLLI